MSVCNNMSCGVINVFNGLNEHNNATSQKDETMTFSSIIPDDVTEFLFWLNWIVISTLLCFFGLTANIINIIVFVKQGFQETVNITLCALAISDLGSFITLLWMTICINPYFRYADTPLMTIEVLTVSGGWPHMIFVKITGWLTVFLTFERCMCVIFPLKVKSILTPARVKFINVFINLYSIATILPIMITTKLAWKFVPERNRTVIGIVATKHASQVDGFVYIFNGIISSFVVLALMVLFTAILIFSLKDKSKWRVASTGNEKNAQQSVIREQKLVKMLIIIAAISICCQVPFAATSIPKTMLPGFSVVGKYKNLFLLIKGYALIFEGINASMNIIIYDRMNTKYRVTFRELFNLSAKNLQ